MHFFDLAQGEDFLRRIVLFFIRSFFNLTTSRGKRHWAQHGVVERMQRFRNTDMSFETVMAAAVAAATDAASQPSTCRASAAHCPDDPGQGPHQTDPWRERLGR
jgi:hypothetical protein